jgi:hypothetical protein
MIISLTEFKKRINEDNLYKFLAETYQNKTLCIPKDTSSKMLLVRALLKNNIKPSKIYKDYHISYRYINSIKSNLNKLSRAEKVFDRLTTYLGRKQGRAIVLHLIKTCGGCSVYFKYKRPKLYKFILAQHLEGRTVDEIMAEFEGLTVQTENTKQKITCTKKYVQRIISAYKRQVDPLYLPKRYKRTDISYFNFMETSECRRSKNGQSDNTTY